MSISWNRDIYQKAARFACELHADQRVKDSSANYALHLANVSMEVIATWHCEPDFDIDLAIQTAWHHDTLEDTNVSAELLQSEFGQDVFSCVKALTKNHSLPYAERMPDVLQRLEQTFREASIVKLADRITNLQKPPSSWSKEKRISYCHEAVVIGESLKGRCFTLEQRLKEKVEEYRCYC